MASSMAGETFSFSTAWRRFSTACLEVFFSCDMAAMGARRTTAARKQNARRMINYLLGGVGLRQMNTSPPDDSASDLQAQAPARMATAIVSLMSNTINPRIKAVYGNWTANICAVAAD